MAMNKRQRLAATAEAIFAIRDNRPLNINKGGYITTKPVVPCKRLPERDVLKQCQNWLKKRCCCRRLNNGYMQLDPFNTENNSGYQYGMKGGADLQCIYRGLHIDIECKQGAGGRLSPEQQQRKHEVEANGGVFLVVHGVEELEYLWNNEILTRF